MKKVFVFTLGAALLLSSCDTYTGMGAYTGANIGGILGSAIGGLSGGSVPQLINVLMKNMLPGLRNVLQPANVPVSVEITIGI